MDRRYKSTAQPSTAALRHTHQSGSAGAKRSTAAPHRGTPHPDRDSTMCKARVQTTNLVSTGPQILEATTVGFHSGMFIQSVVATIGIVTFLLLLYYTCKHLGWCRRTGQMNSADFFSRNGLPMYNMTPPALSAPPLPPYEPPRMMVHSHLSQPTNQQTTSTPLHHRQEFQSQ